MGTCPKCGADLSEFLTDCTWPKARWEVLCHCGADLEVIGKTGDEFLLNHRGVSVNRHPERKDSES